MYHQLYTQDGSNDLNQWLDSTALAMVDMFETAAEAEEQKENRENASMIPYLLKHLKFLQSRVLKVSGNLLETGNWSRSGKSKVLAGKESCFEHQSFLQVILTCIKELDSDSKQKKERGADKEDLLQSIIIQISTYLCFSKDEKIYNYQDGNSRKLMQDSLRLRLSLVGGMFDTIYKNSSATMEWSTLFVQLIVRGVVDLTKNAALFVTVLDMLAALIHSTLVCDRDASQSERSHSYHTLVKKLKKEIGDSDSVSVKFLRQLLPLPKWFQEAIVSDPFGTVTDSKGNKVRGFNCDKKQGLQVSDKQKINPWDILEGHRHPAPMSWTWFGSVKLERKPLRYEESFGELKYASNSLEHAASYYWEPPPLPAEDLQEPQSKANKENDRTMNPVVHHPHMLQQHNHPGHMMVRGGGGQHVMAGMPMNPMMRGKGQMMGMRGPAGGPGPFPHSMRSANPMMQGNPRNMMPRAMMTPNMMMGGNNMGQPMYPSASMGGGQIMTGGQWGGAGGGYPGGNMQQQQQQQHNIQGFQNQVSVRSSMSLCA